MTKVKDKELTKVEVSDNGEAKEPTLKEELQSIVNQANEAIAERNKQDDLYKRCLGAIEVLEQLQKEEPTNEEEDE